MSHRPRPDPADAEGDGAAAEAASARRSAGSGGGPAPARAHAPEPAPAPAHAQRIPHVRNLHWENEVDVKRLLESSISDPSVRKGTKGKAIPAHSGSFQNGHCLTSPEEPHCVFRVTAPHTSHTLFADKMFLNGALRLFPAGSIAGLR
eukprot:gene19460-biopygen42452